MFAEGYSAYNHNARKVFENRVRKLQLDSFPNYDLLRYMQTQEMEILWRNTVLPFMPLAEKL